MINTVWRYRFSEPVLDNYKTSEPECNSISDKTYPGITRETCSKAYSKFLQLQD